jgi:hypothetical protein
MFLPVILVSEFGNFAWFVFAIPNVIGAAAMGWTLAKPGASEQIVAEHRTACVAFSAVTMVFQIFFLLWLSSKNLIPGSFAIAAFGGGIVLGLLSRGVKRTDFLLAWIVWGISLAVFARGMQHPVFGVSQSLNLVPRGSAFSGLTAVCLFGFLLCPYLDLTFHRARQNTAPTAGKAAFGIGFGLVFLLMIVLTMLYAGDFALDQTLNDRFGSFGGALLITWVAFHISSQIGFTLAAHVQAMPVPKPREWVVLVVAVLLLVGSVIALRQQVWSGLPLNRGNLASDGAPVWIVVERYFAQVRFQMFTGDLVYRLFMSFYGLVFPAYVWICMVPLRGRSPGASPRAIGVFATAVAIAAPMFWLGFINERMLWLIPAVTLVLSARVVVWIGTGRPARASLRGERY